MLGHQFLHEVFHILIFRIVFLFQIDWLANFDEGGADVGIGWRHGITAFEFFGHGFFELEFDAILDSFFDICRKLMQDLLVLEHRLLILVILSMANFENFVKSLSLGK